MKHPEMAKDADTESILCDARTAEVQEIITAHAIVRDLMRPRAGIYWAELLLSGSAAWLSFLLAASLPLGSGGMWVALAAATLLFFRVSIFIHELTHQHHRELPGFHLAWNLFIGIPMLLPSVMYEGVHKDHHSKTIYGTANDPEYLPFASRPALTIGFVFLGLLVPLGLLMRFIIDPPISWVVPSFRNLLERRFSSFCFNPLYCRTMTADERWRLLRWEVAILVVWLPVLAATLAGWLPWTWLLLWTGMYATIATINHVRELVAHRYKSDGQPLDHTGQLRDSLDTPGAWWTALWAPLGLRFHALHHLFPKLPYHNLRQAHRRLTRLLPGDAVYRQCYNPSFAQGFRRLLRER